MPISGAAAIGASGRAARNDEEGAGLQRLKDFVLDELNVKELASTHAAGDLVDVEVFPYPKQLGQKYGRGYPQDPRRHERHGPERSGRTLQGGRSRRGGG